MRFAKVEYRILPGTTVYPKLKSMGRFSEKLEFKNWTFLVFILHIEIINAEILVNFASFTTNEWSPGHKTRFF